MDKLPKLKPVSVEKLQQEIDLEMQEFQEFLEFKRMKQTMAAKRESIRPNELAQNGSEPKADILVILGLICFLLSGVYAFMGNAKYKEFDIGAFIFLAFFYTWGYGINKEAAYLMARLNFFLCIGWWAIWKAGGFN